MVGRRGRPAKRKVEELQEDLTEIKTKSKEARIEAISLDGSDPAHITLVTLQSDIWTHVSSEEWNEEKCAPISHPEEASEGKLSQGTCWRGFRDPPQTKVALSCRREPNGDAYDCGTQTCHFTPVLPSKVLVVPDSNSAETIKVEIDIDQQEEFVSHPLVCCVEGCEMLSNVDNSTTTTFYTVPKGRERAVWAEAFNIIPCTEGDMRQHICSKHFLTSNSKTPTSKAKTRRKKTCDMLVAEEAEKIRQGLTSGRLKRTPKPNKNYDWATIVPLIKSEPGDVTEISHLDSSGTSEAEGSFTVNPKRHLQINLKEDKENKRPINNPDRDLGEEEEEEEEEDLENISRPTQPRPPAPKPKGRPHWIRNSNTQTEYAYEKPTTRPPLREVKVQCNINSEPSSPCTTCSYINWLRLEELLVECCSQVEGDLCIPQVKECLRKVVETIPHPTHATNVLKLLSGDERDGMENTSDIILAAHKEDEVEIENFIHTALQEETMTGFREITPKTWQKKSKWKKSPLKMDVINKEEDDPDDPDGFGIMEATEMDDDEFNPIYPEEESEEEDQGLDDEDWTMNKPDKDAKSAAKRRPKKITQQSKGKKGRIPGGKIQDQEMEVMKEIQHSQEDPSLGNVESDAVTSLTRKRKKTLFDSTIHIVGNETSRQLMAQKTKTNKEQVNQDVRWYRGLFGCSMCELVFSTKLKMEKHLKHKHKGIPPWKGSHPCLDCGKTFTQKIGLQVHRMHKHGDPKQFPCHLCSHKAVTKGKLNRHLRSHFNDKKWTCEVCGVLLKTKDTYNNHMALHTGKGRYHCKVCNKAFNHKQYYDDHYRSHFNVRKYKCVMCHLNFKTNNSLRTHVRAVHLNDKRMVCPICGARFMTNFNLQGHMKKHNKPTQSHHNQLQCGLCHIKLNSQSEMKFHLKHVHSEQHGLLHLKIAEEGNPSTTSNCVNFISDPEGGISGIIKYKERYNEVEMIGGACEGMRERVNITCIGSGEENDRLQIQSHEVVEGIENVEDQTNPYVSVIYVYECDKCEETFSSVALLSDHQVLNHPHEDTMVNTEHQASHHLDKDISQGNDL